MRVEIQGIGAADGIAIGPIWVYQPIELAATTDIVSDTEAELTALHQALATAGEQLTQLATRTRDTIGAEEAEIFEAHHLFLEDPDLVDMIETMIRDHRFNAAYAAEKSAETYADSLRALDDVVFQERANDIIDVGRRIVACLRGIDLSAIEMPAMPTIIIAEDLTPSDTVQFDRSKVLGLVTVRGGPTSHTAILARSQNLPAIVSAPIALGAHLSHQQAILDGESGQLIIQPTADEVAAASAVKSAWQSTQASLIADAGLPAVTRDGKQFEIVANVGNVDDAQQAIALGAEGVGLFRTEFLFLARSDMPTEAEQVAAYQAVFEVMGNRPIVVRTLDIGGDKTVPYLGIKTEPNPFLGWRAIRMIDERPDVLACQFRALLRAGVGRDVRIMLPLVSQVSEVIKARHLLDEAQATLKADGLPFATTFQFGIMVEVPAVALQIAAFAPHVDFFSIGTNDLTQYTLAVDRMNERVAHLASPYHPAVLKLIEATITTAHAHGKWVGLCGEFAADKLAAPLLVGWALDEFSMAAAAIPQLKATIRALDSVQACEIAAHALTLDSADSVIAYLRSLSVD